LRALFGRQGFHEGGKVLSHGGIWLLMTCTVSFRPKYGTRPVFYIFVFSNDFITQKRVFLAVNASLHWFYNVSCLFLSFLLIISGIQLFIDRSVGRYWLPAYITLRVVDAVLVVFLRHWRKICTIFQPMGSKGRYLLTN
jgi:hypothetical protein